MSPDVLQRGGMSKADATKTEATWMTPSGPFPLETLPLLRALRASAPDGDRAHLSAIERCVLNADDEGYGGELAEQALKELRRPQAFFAQCAAAARAPACGDFYKTIVGDLLKQAEAQGLYTPEPT